MGVLTGPGRNLGSPPVRPRTVPERLRAAQPALTPGERRVARFLLAGYPLAGLDPVAALAERSGASAPTVLRLVGKLGFDGYPAFQRAIKDELAARLSSPLQMYPSGLSDPNGPNGPNGPNAAGGAAGGRDTAGGAGDPGGAALLAPMREALIEAVRAGFASIGEDDVEAAVRLLAVRRRVWTLGGRFSGMLADYLAAHLQLLRPAVTTVAAAPAGRAAALLEVDRGAVVVAFDYRRYQRDTIEFGTAAKGQGAAVLLFTDYYLSPLASVADVVLATPVQAPSPFDVLTPAVAVVEALITAVLRRLGDAPRARMAHFDRLSSDIVVGGEPTLTGPVRSLPPPPRSPHEPD